MRLPSARAWELDRVLRRSIDRVQDRRALHRPHRLAQHAPILVEQNRMIGEHRHMKAAPELVAIIVGTNDGYRIHLHQEQVALGRFERNLGHNRALCGKARIGERWREHDQYTIAIAHPGNRAQIRFSGVARTSEHQGHGQQNGGHWLHAS
jgi:hypothetical protein